MRRKLPLLMPLLALLTTSTITMAAASEASSDRADASATYFLHSVDAIAPDDVWAVGQTETRGTEKTLTEHWDGSTWSVVSSPTPGGHGYLLDVSAVSSDDVWAVGSTDFEPIVIHWDGSDWTSVSTPPIKNDFPVLSTVSATASDNAWLAGYVARRAILEHWDGEAWTRTPFPHRIGTGHPEPHDIVAFPTGDSWTVGEHYALTGYVSMVARWQDGSWAKQHTPDPPDKSGTWTLNGVSGTNAGDVWAAGLYYDAVGYRYPLLEHWNGSRWTLTLLDGQHGQPSNISFDGIDAVSSSDVWAVGSHYPRNHDRTLIEHWDGSGWRVTQSPDPGGNGDNILFGVSADTATDAWAVGERLGPDDNDVPMIMHWDGSSWSQVRVPRRR